jgi:ATPsyn_F1gamma: ATP synthase F1, gamma subunit
MANIREIKTRMNSIEDTLKITNAMYLISSSKLKKARKQLDATTPYFEMLQASLLDIMAHTPDLQHYFLKQKKERTYQKRISCDDCRPWTCRGL